MFKKINLQFLLSYLGLFPFIIILLDKFFFKYLNYNIVNDFSIFYSIIIFVFIGATNWNLKKNISFFSLFMGFIPSLASVFLITIYLYSYNVVNYLMVCLTIQLVFDNLNYTEKKDRVVYYKLRMPLTLIILISLIFIQF